MAFGNKEAALMLRIKGDASGVERAISQADARLSGFSSMVGRSAGLWAAVGTAATGALMSIGSALKDGTVAVINYSARIEQIKIGLASLTGSAATANRLFAQIQKFSIGTPFDVEALTKVAQRMVSVGIETSKVVPLMKDLGNIVAATGEVSAERLEGITVALTQMISKTKVSAEEMEQLAERGVPAWKLLSDAMGKSQSEVRKLAEQGKITSDVMVAALQKMSQQRFGDAMQKQSQTFQGSLSVLKNLLMKFAAEAFEPTYKELSKFAAKMSSTLQQQAPGAKSAFDKFGYSLGVALGDGIRRYFQSKEWGQIYKDYIAGIALFPGAVPTGVGIGRGLVTGATQPPEQPRRSPDYNRPTEIVTNGRTPTVSSEDLEKQAKEAEDIAKRNLSAGLQLWRNYIEALKAQYKTAIDAFKTEFERTGDADALTASIGNANAKWMELIDAAQKKINAIEDEQIKAEKKTSAEIALINQERAARYAELADMAAQSIRDAEEWKTATTRKEAEKRISIAESEAARQLAITRAQTETEIAALELKHQRGEITEIQLLEWVQAQREALIDKERALIRTRLADTTLDAETRAELKNRLLILDAELTESIIRNSAAREAALQSETEAMRQVGLAIEEIWAQMEATMVGESGDDSAQSRGGLFDSWTESWSRFFESIVNQAPTLASVLGDVAGMLQNAMQGMAQAVGQVVEQWVLYGETGPAVMKKILAAALASLAAEAAMRAIFHAAMGFALLFFNPGAAAEQFIAAAIFGSIAVGAGLAGRAVAGDSFKQQAATGATGANTQSSRSSQAGAYSEQGTLAVNGGRNASAGNGGVLVIRDRSGMFSALFQAEWERNGPMRQFLTEQFAR